MLERNEMAAICLDFQKKVALLESSVYVNNLSGRNIHLTIIIYNGSMHLSTYM